MNTPITITATATGGTAVQYQFWVYDAENGDWSQLQAYSPTSTCTWTPLTTGDFLISVTAQDDVTGAEVNNMLWYTIAVNPLTGISLSATPPSPQQAYTPIILQATATGGTAVQYMFWVYSASSCAWSQLQAYSASATCTWTPEAADSYLLSVTAQDTTTGTEVNALAWYTVTAPTQNPVDGASMVWVPGGTFTMGCTVAEDDGYASGGETQQVRLSGYWIYTNEVTVAQYLAFCAATGYPEPPFPGDYDSWAVTYDSDGNTDGWSDPAVQQFPIVNVPWNDAQAYAKWAGVSLPTEAQYEYAARGPAENNYPWGGTATSVDPNNGWNGNNCANYWNSYLDGISTWPVGSFPQGASWCGAQDLAGNVWEWCYDWYGDYSSTPVTNPTGPATGTGRVLRGGSWYVSVEYILRGAYRGYRYPGSWNDYIGFRCVASLPGS